MDSAQNEKKKRIGAKVGREGKAAALIHQTPSMRKEVRLKRKVRREAKEGGGWSTTTGHRVPDIRGKEKRGGGRAGEKGWKDRVCPSAQREGSMRREKPKEFWPEKREVIRSNPRELDERCEPIKKKSRPRCFCWRGEEDPIVSPALRKRRRCG